MTNFKKAALAVLALGVSSVAAAGMYVQPPVENTEPTLKNGFYAGIGLGGIGFKSTTSASGSAEGSLGPISGNAQGAYSDTGGNVGLNSSLFLGYAWHLPKKMFLGVEAFGNLMNTPVSTSTSGSGNLTATVLSSAESINGEGSAITDFTLRSAYGLRALPGYQVASNAVIYGIAGWVNAQVKSTESSTATVTSDAGTETIPYSTSNHYNFNGYQLGIGSMISITDHILVRGDLIYSGYSSKDILSGTETIATDTVNASGEGTISASPSSLEADVALVYMFD